MKKYRKKKHTCYYVEESILDEILIKYLTEEKDNGKRILWW